jgi:uncharacterized protein (TIGR03435 family)
MIAAVLLMLGFAPPQAPDPARGFEVASIRLSAGRQGGEGSNRSHIEYTPTSVRLRNVDVAEAVEWAYNVKYYQLDQFWKPRMGPYDIEARTETSASVPQLRLMLRNLLTERFKLTLHWETKETAVYELRIAKGGPKLPKPNADSAAHALEKLPRIVDGSFLFADASMDWFAVQLSQLAGIERPVVDRTDIEGYYDILLKSAANAIRDPNGPSIAILLEEQLGLKLVSARAPMQILVIDRVEKPTEN